MIKICLDKHGDLRMDRKCNEDEMVLDVINCKLEPLDFVPSEEALASDPKRLLKLLDCTIFKLISER